MKRLSTKVMLGGDSIELNPLKYFIPISGDKLMHTLMKSVRSDIDKLNKRGLKRAFYALEAGFYLGKYGLYT